MKHNKAINNCMYDFESNISMRTRSDLRKKNPVRKGMNTFEANARGRNSFILSLLMGGISAIVSVPEYSYLMKKAKSEYRKSLGR